MSIDDVIDIDSASRFGGAHSVGLVETHHWTCYEPLLLDCGRSLSPITQAYETYGELSPERDNAVLIFHALTGDAHAAGYHDPSDRRPGWWDIMVGPGKAFDTDRYFVICINVLGGCRGSTGPSSVNPQTGAPYGLEFPILTLSDMVRAQERLISHLGIERLLCVVGGSMGGMMALDWAVRYPARVASVIAIATTARLTAQGIAFNEVGRQAIMADPDWRRGDYYGQRSPEAGLAVARMIAHITYLSNQQMHHKFGRRLQDREALGYDFGTEFQVESYLRYQGNAFVRRFDANTYLYITKAIDYFDIANGQGSLVQAFEAFQAEALVVSFSSDWLFPTEQSRELVRALQANGVPTTFTEIESDYGHDAFFLPNAELSDTVTGFLSNAYGRVRGQRGEA